jgi:5'-3' exonuclease
MTKLLLAVDGNSIAHANDQANTLTVGTMEVQAIFGFLHSMRKLMQTYPNGTPLILWDGRAEFRYELYPEYKGNRVAKTPEEQASKDAFKRQTPFIEKFMEYLGVRQLRSPLLEADDLGWHTVAARPGTRTVMVTGDRDWLRMVNATTTWFDPIRDRKVSLENFLEFTGFFSPEEFAQGKAINGDANDNVPGVDGMGEKSAACYQFIAKWKTVQAFWDAVDSGAYTPATRKSKTAKSLHPEQFLASEEGRALVRRNFKLLDLAQARKPLPGEVQIVHKKPDPEKFLHLCERLNFASILRDRRAFLQNFGIDVPAPAMAMAA